MSLTACIIILIVLLARLCLKRAPKIFSYVLWSVVLFRLLCPISISLPVSVLAPMSEASTSVGTSYTASMEYISLPEHTDGSNAQAQQPVPGENIENDNTNESTAPPADPEADTSAVVEQQKISAEEIVLTVLGWLWSAGVVGVLGITAWQTFSLKRRLADACIIRGNIFESDKIDTAFILGVFNPKIYLPLGLPFDIQKAVVAHEQTHQRRGDHIVKLVSYIALAIHWFNPLVWLSFKLMCDDMEKSCDEAVIRTMTDRGYAEKSMKKAYSKMLFALGGGKQHIFSPVSFAENSTKERVLNIVDYTRIARNTGVVLCSICVLVIGLCAFNPIISSTTQFGPAPHTEGLVFSLDGQNKFGNPLQSPYLPQDNTTFATVIDYIGSSQYVAIPETYQGLPVIAIADSAFSNTSIISISIPQSVVYLGSNAFSGCSLLEKVTVPDSVMQIGAALFSDCVSLSYVSLSDNIQAIYSSTFLNCSSLTQIELPSELCYVHKDAFTGSGIEKCINIAGYDTFSNGSYNIKNLYIDESFFKVGDFGFSRLMKDAKNISDEIITVEISGKTKHIGMNAFNGCNQLETVILHDGVEFIDENAFLFCSNIDTIILPDSVHTIADSAGLIPNDSLVIYCNTGSYASLWAEEYGFNIMPIDSFG